MTHTIEAGADDRALKVHVGHGAGDIPGWHYEFHAADYLRAAVVPNVEKWGTLDSRDILFQEQAAKTDPTGIQRSEATGL